MEMKACVFTLGCKMNEAESESLMTALQERGYEVTDKLSYADLYILNTCAVTAEAEKKSRQAIARMRKFNKDAKIAVCGCASERDASVFAKKEGVYLVTGAMQKRKLLDLLDEGGIFCGSEQTFCELPYPARTRTRAFVRIQDGCNRFCSYCIIPYLRGRSRSRSAGSILGEVSSCGAKEIVLTGVDLSSYKSEGCDLSGLLLRLKDIPARIRFGSLEVSAITEEFLAAAKAAPVMPHFHLSLQSGSDAVLRAMNRKYTREEYLAACARVKEAFPTAAITTDIIVGYPTETEEDFKESLSIVREAGFAHVHVFPFSPREGTVASKLPDLPPEVKRERTARLIKEAAAQEEQFIRRFLGTEATVLFEEDGGYTENYIRAYAENAKEGELKRVRLLERVKDGVRAEIIGG